MRALFTVSLIGIIVAVTALTCNHTQSQLQVPQSSRVRWTVYRHEDGYTLWRYDPEPPEKGDLFLEVLPSGYFVSMNGIPVVFRAMSDGRSEIVRLFDVEHDISSGATYRYGSTRRHLILCTAEALKNGDMFQVRDLNADGALKITEYGPWGQ